MPLQNTLLDIRNKVRRITGRPSSAQITDQQIDDYINTFYVYDLSEHLRLESFRYNYQFLTNANQPVYDFPTDYYLTNMPPVYVGGYESYMTQSRSNFFRINPEINFLQQQVATGNGTGLGYYFTLTNTPILKGFKPNPPGAYSDSNVTDLPAKDLLWNVLISGTGLNGQSVSLIDDGQGNLFDLGDLSTSPGRSRGTINYATGHVSIPTAPVSLLGFSSPIAQGAPINCQYTPYVASRPQSVCFYQDQFYLYPIPDQAYTVSFECYKYPTVLLLDNDSPQLKEMWQLLAYGAADKIFSDNADMENMQKFRPLLDEQMRLVQRRSIVQQTAERTATIYTEQLSFGQYPFGNLF